MYEHSLYGLRSEEYSQELLSGHLGKHNSTILQFPAGLVFAYEGLQTWWKKNGLDKHARGAGPFQCLAKKLGPHRVSSNH